jgi:hypothetical protein
MAHRNNVEKNGPNTSTELDLALKLSNAVP